MVQTKTRFERRILRFGMITKSKLLEKNMIKPILDKNAKRKVGRRLLPIRNRVDQRACNT